MTKLAPPATRRHLALGLAVTAAAFLLFQSISPWAPAIVLLIVAGSLIALAQLRLKLHDLPRK